MVVGAGALDSRAGARSRRGRVRARQNENRAAKAMGRPSGQLVPVSWIPGLPKNSWVSWVQASNFNPGMAYAADNNVDNTSKDVRGRAAGEGRTCVPPLCDFQKNLWIRWC